MIFHFCFLGGKNVVMLILEGFVKDKQRENFLIIKYKYRNKYARYEYEVKWSQYALRVTDWVGLFEWFIKKYEDVFLFFLRG